MARVTRVKKAQVSKRPRTCFKCSHVIEPGESYYFWGVRTAMKRGYKKFACAQHRPTARDMERSAFRLSLYDIDDSLSAAVTSFRAGLSDPDFQGLGSELRNIGEQFRELGSECEGSYENMPDGLKEGGTGQLLYQRNETCQERGDECDSAADDIEGMENDIIDPETWVDYAGEHGIEREEDEGDDDFETRVREAIADANSEKAEEAASRAEEIDTSID